MIELHGVSRSYGAVLALKPIDLTIPGGVIVGLLGANGAGKTTLLNLLVTLLQPTTGRVVVDGIDAAADPLAVRRLIGFVPEHGAAYDGLTADEYLELAAEVRGLGPEWRDRASRFLEHFGLSEARGRRLGTYSKGMRSKTLLAAALLHDPRVLVLDEPMNGLDVAGQRQLSSLMSELAASGRTIVLSSHVLEQVERTCGHLVLIHEGRLLWQGGVAELRERHAGAPLADVFLRMTAPGQGPARTWAELLGVS